MLMEVTLTTEKGVALIKLNRPPANSYNLDFYRQIHDHVLDIRFRPEIKAVVLLSEVPKFFSAGADIKYLRETDPAIKTQFCLLCNETLDMMGRSPQIYIACIEGHCVGGGLEIAMGCDLRFAGDRAGKIGLPEVTLGVLPGTGGTQRMARLVGKSKALDLCITGQTLSPQEALAAGLIDRIFPQEEIRAQTIAYAEKIAGGPSYAASNIKLSIMNGMEMPLNVAIRYEGELQNLLFRSQDAKEGIQAFLEKRAPQFRGQ